MRVYILYQYNISYTLKYVFTFQPSFSSAFESWHKHMDIVVYYFIVSYLQSLYKLLAQGLLTNTKSS